MGAEGRTEVFQGKLNSSEVSAKLKKLSRDADEYSGHQDGYSGDWNTISGTPRLIASEVFENAHKAEDALERLVEKWDAGFAYFYSTKKVEPSAKEQAKIEKLKEELKDLSRKAESTKSLMLSAQRAILDYVAKSADNKVSCKHCESTFELKFINSKCFETRKELPADDTGTIWLLVQNEHEFECPVCHKDVGSIRGLGNLKSSMEKAIKNYNSLMTEKIEVSTKLRESNKTEKGEIMTMLYGLCAC